MKAEFKYNQEIIRKNYAAYSLGAYSDSSNTYRPGTHNWLAFNLGRDWKTRSDHVNPLFLRKQKG